MVVFLLILGAVLLILAFGFGERLIEKPVARLFGIKRTYESITTLVARVLVIIAGLLCFIFAANIAGDHADQTYDRNCAAKGGVAVGYHTVCVKPGSVISDDS